MLYAYLRLIHLAKKVPGLRGFVWALRCRYHALCRCLLLGNRPVVDGNALIREAIETGRPFAAGKVGLCETQGVLTGLRRKKARALGQKEPSYAYSHALALHVNAGVFPKDENVFDRFGEVYLDAVKTCSALGLVDLAGEAEIIRKFGAHLILMRMADTEPYYFHAPWSRALKGKRVLVISPFVGSIEKQYAQRELLWDDPDVLPAFELLTIRAPLSAGLVPPKAPDWFHALSEMKAQMDNLDYDVVLIGAGAFSLPLAAHAKTRGKVGIHMGGGLQVLFGVVGKRWREDKSFRKYIKPSWRSPSAEETPSTCGLTEGGCYW